LESQIANPKQPRIAMAHPTILGKGKVSPAVGRNERGKGYINIYKNKCIYI
jgi:hypothetical protein